MRRAARARDGLRVAVTGAAIAVAVGGCGSHSDDGTPTGPHPLPSAVVTFVPRSAPPGYDLPHAEPTSEDDLWGTAAVWSDTPGHLYLVTTGSGSCPVLPTKVTWTAAGELDVAVAEDTLGAKVCTADLVATTTTLDLDGHADGGALVVHVSDARGRSTTIDVAARG
jgi:hypothetical protein